MSLEVPQLNYTFDVPKSLAQNLWDTGVPMPEEAGRHPLEFQRIRLSDDGNWVVRLARPFDAETNTRDSIREFELLRELGLSTISFATTPISTRRMITIVPWIDGLRPVDRRRYRQHVMPPLLTYYQKATQRTNAYLSVEIIPPEQYSILPGEKPFLRDVDAYLHKGKRLAQHIVKVLSN